MSEPALTGEDAAKLKVALEKERTVGKEMKEHLRQARERLADAERRIAEAGVIADPKSELVAQHIDNMVKAQLAGATTTQLAKIAQLETELTESRAATEAARGAFATKTIEQTLRDAAAKNFVLPAAIDDVVKLGKLECRLDDDGNVKTATDGTIEDFIDALKASSPYLWPAAVGSGGLRGRSARGDNMSSELLPGSLMGEANPFDKNSPAWSLTKQGDILKSDPKKAEAMMAAVR